MTAVLTELHKTITALTKQKDDLLAALEECLAWAENQGWHHPGVSRCKAIIAKVKGDQ